MYSNLATPVSSLSLFHHHVRSAEAGHSWDVHHRRIRLSGYHGEADRSHVIPSGRVHLPILHALAAHPSLSFRLGEAALMPTLALASGKVSHSPSKRGVPPVRMDGTHVRGCRVCFVSAFQLTRTRTSRLPASQVGMIVDKGGNFPPEIDATLRTYGENMWFFREQPGDTTTRALNSYIGDHRKWVPNNTTYPPRSTPGVSNRVPSAVTMMRLLVLCVFFFFSSHVSQAFNTLRLEYVSLLVT